MKASIRRSSGLKPVPPWAACLDSLVSRGSLLRKIGMASEWEVSFLGFWRWVVSVLEEAVAPLNLRWSYDGPVEGWGE